jgi:hypothetical protein
MRNSGLVTLVLVFALVSAGLSSTVAQAAPPAAPASVIKVDGRSPGPIYQGAGAVSAGASSRLLYDYPEPQRSQILDYLFKPGYGAQLQILKAEIGSDANSTAGSEPTHERARGQVNCGRGYEWWLMREARKRNPNIKLEGLEWAVPGWFRGGFWSQDNINYQMSWLGCAAKQGLKINYVGGWNERGYESSWLVAFKQALAKRYPGVRLMAADDCCRDDLWRVADSMAADPQFNNAVNDIGVHFACGHRTDYSSCSSTPTARSLRKPLWMSENSALTHRVGAGPAARALNRSYLDGNMSGYMTWSAVSSWYANLPISDTGVLLAEWPWSGHYEIGKTMWAFAHTTRFAQPGWHYVPGASGKLANGTTFVTRAGPAGKQFSTVVETMDAKGPNRIAVRPVGAGGPLSVWSSDLRSNNPRDHFVRIGQVPSAGALTLRPGHVYTITNSRAGGKGTASPKSTVDPQLGMPFKAIFDRTPIGGQARFFSDVNGSFASVPCAGGRPGNCYEQQTTELPITWSPPGSMDPTTIVGDPRWWGDYQVGARMLLRKPGSADLLGRMSTQTTSESKIGGYFLHVSSNSGWQLVSDDQFGGRSVIAAGLRNLSVGRWHQVALRMKGSTLTVLLDGKAVRTVRDASQTIGNVGLRAGQFQKVQFDDLTVTPTGPSPAVVPRSQLRASATSVSGIDRGYDYFASNAVDGRPESNWKPAADEALPQAITLDTGRRQRVGGLLVQPQYEVVGNAPITGYRISVSQNGRSYRQVAGGSWSPGWNTKLVRFPRTDARFVRLEVLETSGSDGTAGVGQLNVLR